jgi:hypothetical protein
MAMILFAASVVFLCFGTFTARAEEQKRPVFLGSSLFIASRTATPVSVPELDIAPKQTKSAFSGTSS